MKKLAGEMGWGKNVQKDLSQLGEVY